MTDPRFTTVCEDPDQLLAAVDVDDLEDIDTFLMFLFHRPVGVLHLEDETGDAMEVRLWDDHGDLDGVVRFPLSLLDLVLLCAEHDDHLGPYTKAGTNHPEGRTRWGGMTDSERDLAMLDALGNVRIFNIMNDPDN